MLTIVIGAFVKVLK